MHFIMKVGCPKTSSEKILANMYWIILQPALALACLIVLARGGPTTRQVVYFGHGWSFQLSFISVQQVSYPWVDRKSYWSGGGKRKGEVRK